MKKRGTFKKEMDINRIYDNYETGRETLQERDGNQIKTQYDIHVDLNGDVRVTLQEKSDPLLHKYKICLDPPHHGVGDEILENISTTFIYNKKVTLD